MPRNEDYDDLQSKLDRQKRENKKLRKKLRDQEAKAEKREADNLRNISFGLADDLNKMMDSFDKSMRKNFKNLTKDLGDMLEELIDETTTKARASVDDIGDDLEDAVEEASESMEDDFLSSLDSLKKDMEKAFKEMNETREKLFQETQEDIDDALKESTRADYRNQISNINDLLKSYKNLFRENHRMLSRADQEAFVMFYKNRRDDIRALEREFRDRLGDMQDEVEDVSADMKDNFDSVKDSLLDWANALNLNDIKDKMTGTADSIAESMRDVQNSLHWTDQEASDYIDKIYSTARDTLKNKKSAEDLGAELNSAFAEASINDAGKRVDYVETLSAAAAAMNEDASSLVGILKADADLGAQGTLLTQAAATQIELMKQGYSEFNTADVMNSASEMFQQLSVTYDTAEEAQKGLQSLIETNALIGNAWYGDLGAQIADPINTLMTDLSKLNEYNLADYQSSTAGILLGGNLTTIANMVQSGQTREAYAAILQSLMEAEYSNNRAFTEFLGDDADVVDLFDRTSGDILNNLTNFEATMGNPEDVVSQSLEDFQVGKLDQLGNTMKNSWLGEQISMITSQFDVSLSDILLAIEAMRTIQGLTGGLNIGGGKGKGVKGIFNTIKNFFTGGSKGAKAASTAASGLKAASTAANAAKGAEAAVSAAKGANAVAGAAEAASAVSTGSKVLSGASKLIKGAGPLALIGGAIDAFGGVTSNDSWFGENANVGTGIASAVGGFLGGTGSGIMDENTDALTKGLDVGGGALKGAGIGALIGSVVPGLGTAIGGAIGAGVGAIGSAIGGENIAKFFGETIPQKFTEAAEYITNGAKSIADAYQEDGIGGALNQIGENLKQGASDLHSQILQIPVIGDGLKNVENFVADTAKAVIDSPVGQTIGQTLSSGWDFLTGLFTDPAKKNGHASGIDFVRKDNLLTLLHKGEGVLTADENRMYSGSPSLLPTISSDVSSINTILIDTYKIQKDYLIKINRNLNTLVSKSNTTASRTTPSILSGTSSTKSFTASISSAAQVLTKSNPLGNLIGNVVGNVANTLTSMLPGAAVGTPYVESDQVAVIHRGEAIIPADFNPYNPANSPQTVSDSAPDNSDLVNVIRWAVNRIESKLDEVKDAESRTTTVNNFSNQQVAYPTRTDIAFSF